VSEPSVEQANVLTDPARVRIVHASPGSGKTWLVAELMRRELARWPDRRSGIAALSFTRVGGEEIRKALGYELAHPHFVGTLDAFLFRFVVRPFHSIVSPGLRHPRLIPGEWRPTSWSKNPHGGQWIHRGKGGADARSYNLFDVCFVSEDASGPSMATPKRYGGIDRVAEKDRAGLLQAKLDVWRRLGWFTHSDAALRASSLLEHSTHGPFICRTLARRFPLIIVDELQDTGYFLGKSLQSLFLEPSSRGVLVGDPDQAIFEFNGARPDLFDRFHSLPGASKLPLSASRRCPRKVVDAAIHVKQSASAFDPAADRSGRAVLISYRDMTADTGAVAAAVAARHAGRTIKITARANATVEALAGRSATPPPKLGCPPLTHMCRAISLFRQNRQGAALSAARSALDLASFGHEGVIEETLVASGTDDRRWRAVAARCLIRANAASDDANVFDWQVTVAEILVDELKRGLGALPATLLAKPLRPAHRAGWDNPCRNHFPPTDANRITIGEIPVQTVHTVKGETHDVSIFVCPKARADRCPSVVWWSDAPEDQEERRIAYVAMTRTRGQLLVLVSEECRDRLIAARPQFVASFESMGVDEFLVELVTRDADVPPSVEDVPAAADVTSSLLSPDQVSPS
jgi:DNA helicase-2/ATP-dependent DNA helicase PcrA